MHSRDAFLHVVDREMADLPSETVTQLVERAGGTDRIYLLFVDILNGFCKEGPLASDRVDGMVEPVSRLGQSLVEAGLPGSHLLFLQDDHLPDAKEFHAFPPHCIRGSAEAETVDRLQPFLNIPGVRLFRKNATSALFSQDEQGVQLFQLLEDVYQKGPATFLVVGDCTDLCIYQNAMGIRLLANERNADVRVVVSKEQTRTYHTPVEVAQKQGIPAHDGDLLESIFLYHMKINGIEVVATIEGEQG